MIINKIENIKIKGIKNLIVCLLKIIINIIEKTKSNIGILLPEISIPHAKMINKTGNKYLENLFERFE